ncbi:MAG: VOC family protein [Hyphomicrobiaceae bacterium]|nr:MAG: VOC family protein [Hyphomicrobiaceae bacterium]
MSIEPYLFFNGRCEEALRFYQKSLGAKVSMIMRYKDSPEQSGVTPALADLIMHSAFTIDGATVMASDGHGKGKVEFKGMNLSLSCADARQAGRRFKALAEGGTVIQPLVETFFAKRFGMVADRFGVTWMLMAGPKN